jgi:hydrogenase expression/formation protein HypD
VEITSLKYLEEYRDPAVAQAIAQKIRRLSKRPVRFMEVCGTHTVSIFRNGIRSLLPETISLISGPGCPICVTAQREIDVFIHAARMDDVILTTFGDLMRVPGESSSFQQERAEGCDIRVVYSAMDALLLAQANPGKQVILPAVGFETTAPTTAATLISAKAKDIKNFFVYSAHKLVPPALFALLENTGGRIDGFILPGHVSVIIGARAYRPFFETFRIPCVISGFEPVDILRAILILVQQVETGETGVTNAYERVVTLEGNTTAQKLLHRVFETQDTAWRGIGTIPGSGLTIRKRFSYFDAQERFHIHVPESEEPEGCACGEILSGTKIPPQCPLYEKTCTPLTPVGPCMVSSEGICAAYYRYQSP